VGGVRFEATRMDVASSDTTKPDSLRRGVLDNNDWLPSVNLIYQVVNNMNIRASYGKTLARPTMREKAPYVNYEFVNDYSFAGNVNLERTLIDNFDLRWEWFLRPGELLAISGFYKRFINPIERTIIITSADNPEVTYRNVDGGTVIGLELEARKRLDGIHSWLNNFQLGFNLSLVNSKVNIPEEKLKEIVVIDPNREVFTENTRPLQGQSPYILNIDFGYNNYKIGTFANLYFNIFGERLAEVTSDGTPDVYEQPRSLLNFNMSQRLFGGLGLKFGAKNILNSKIRLIHKYKGEEYVRSEHELGRSFSLGLSYDIN
jgi:TonB-dependent receptor